jgi:hypothetical protein
MYTMKKKILAVVAALAIMTVGTTAFASESPSADDLLNADDVEVAEDQEIEVEEAVAPTASAKEMADATSATASQAGLKIDSKAVAKTTITDAVSAANIALKDVAALADVMEDDTLADAATNPDATVKATITAVVNLEVVKGEIEGDVTITISHKDIKAGHNYVILHYTDGEWVPVKAENIKTGSLDITVDSLSPIAIVEVSYDAADVDDEVDPSTEAPKADSPSTEAPKADAASTEATTAAASTDAGTSPKTGETTPVALFALLACVAGALACSKKSEN